MTDERATISSSRISAADVIRHSFGTVKRGFDPNEVRSFLELVARELQSVEGREMDLRRQIAEAEHRAAHPVLDEATLLSALGQSSAQVLRDAHEEAARITERAEQQAAAVLRAAQEAAADVQVAAETQVGNRIAEVEIQATTLETESREQAAALLESARTDGETLIAHARDQGRAMVEQAQEARRRVLEDMDRRRRRMHVQIEQLRAARDELAAAILGVRTAVDRITDELAHSDEDARLAAMEVSRQQPTLEGLSDEDVAALAGDADPASPLVDELFAKIRASVTEEEEAPPVEEQTDADAAPADVAPSVIAPDSVETPVDEPPTMEQPAVGAAPDDDVALTASTQALTRRVKRALQDDQNAMLERLRVGGLSVAGVIGDDAEQRQRYLDAASEVLRGAAAAGSQVTGAKGPVDYASVDRLAAQMANTVVTLLRRRLADAEDDLTAEHIGAAFREWRGARIDGLVGDVALSAFATGQYAGATSATAVRWTLGTSCTECASCAANVDAGAVRAGSDFPSGHRHPPVHAGCRCSIALS
jgi:DivIVA domain-containing protein